MDEAAYRAQQSWESRKGISRILATADGPEWRGYCEEWYRPDGPPTHYWVELSNASGTHTALCHSKEDALADFRAVVANSATDITYRPAT